MASLRATVRTKISSRVRRSTSILAMGTVPATRASIWLGVVPSARATRRVFFSRSTLATPSFTGARTPARVNIVAAVATLAACLAVAFSLFSTLDWSGPGVAADPSTPGRTEPFSLAGWQLRATPGSRFELTGAAALATLALFTRQPLLVAYIALGCALGPHALQLVDDDRLIRDISEFGIIFLLPATSADLSADSAELDEWRNQTRRNDLSLYRLLQLTAEDLQAGVSNYDPPKPQAAA